MAKRILVLGAGRIGRMVARLLVDSGEYEVRLADLDGVGLARVAERIPVATAVVDALDHAQVRAAMHGCVAVVSALTYRQNPIVAMAALEAGISYFDLTEDRATSDLVRQLAQSAAPGQVFVPQCGLAPGFIGILACHLTQWFEKLDTVRMRVGALSQFPTNSMSYNLTWSTDGLINEYCNRCAAIVDGQLVEVAPLEGLEQFTLDGVRYEAFNTSGGVGTLGETFVGKCRELNYRTIRYPGHHELMKFLLTDLRLADRRELLRDVLESAIPVTFQDIVVVFCTVTGWRRGQFIEKSEVYRVYPSTIGGEIWGAIQVTTGAGVCAVLDLFMTGAIERTGFVRQEEIPFEQFIANRFGQWYRSREVQH
jgi:saccharopine dehydrogenase-like NADP-dependent oxidoreductase